MRETEKSKKGPEGQKIKSRGAIEEEGGNNSRNCQRDSLSLFKLQVIWSSKLREERYLLTICGGRELNLPFSVYLPTHFTWVMQLRREKEGETILPWSLGWPRKEEQN